MDYINRLKTEAVVIPSRFITDYMPQAGGDYVKVFLHLLYDGRADVEKMAEDLQLSEGDIKRALKYWEKQGVVDSPETENNDITESTAEAAGEAAVTAEPVKGRQKASKKDSVRDRYRSTEGTEALIRLSEDETFKELTIIIQKYRSKIMDENETQVFAYLYDGLKLTPEVIEYLVTYSVEHGRNDIRYMEKLGSDWAKIGVSTVDEAKRRTMQFEEGGGKKPARRSSSKPKASEAKAGHSQERHTDYNELVMKELMENMG